MTLKDQADSANTPPPIYIVSGGVGASGEQLAHTVLAQFPDCNVPVITVGNVRHIEQIENVVVQAKNSGGTIIHTLVDVRLRHTLIDLTRQHGIAAFDLVGDLIGRLTNVLGQEPLGQHGLYRKLRHAYFERVAAIEFTLAHDDGRNPQDWLSADIVLAGVSRTGKTPLSTYLSVLGWRVANVPLVLELPTPPELFELNARRVIGLTIDPDVLLMLRQQRFSRLGAPRSADYVDPGKIREEITAALKLFHRSGFSVIDVTDKPIETSADEVIKLIA